jgi:hypothetical protein
MTDPKERAEITEQRKDLKLRSLRLFRHLS